MRIFWQVAQEQTLQQRSSESSLHAQVTMQNQIVTAMHPKTLDVTRHQLTVYAIKITTEINASFISIRICYKFPPPPHNHTKVHGVSKFEILFSTA